MIEHKVFLSGCGLEVSEEMAVMTVVEILVKEKYLKERLYAVERLNELDLSPKYKQFAKKLLESVKHEINIAKGLN